MAFAPVSVSPGDESESSQAPRAYLWLVAVIAALGGLLFGYDFVVIGGAAPFYEGFFQLASSEDKGWAQSCALLGCLAGALASGGLSDKFGRKKLLIASAVLFAVTSLGTGLAGNFNSFVLWRILGGVAIGLASNLSPLYIAEIAPSSIRGRLVSLNQFTIVVGILLAQLVNLWVAGGMPVLFGWVPAEDAAALSEWNHGSGWRWMFGITVVPSMLFLIGMFFVPESPRWLENKNRPEEARRVLERIGGADHAARALERMRDSAQPSAGGVWRSLFHRKTAGILLLGIGLAIFQQWCGINVIFNYAGEIFKSAGYSIDEQLQNMAWTGSVNLVFTVIAMLVVDKLGRRPLMIIGAAGLAIIYLAVGYCYQNGILGGKVLALVLAAIGCYAATLAPVTWVVISEIFPNRIRGAAMSIAVFFLWLACFVLTYTFPIMNDTIGAAYTFWTYAGICVAGLLLILFALPETKGKSLEQIERELTD